MKYLEPHARERSLLKWCESVNGEVQNQSNHGWGKAKQDMSQITR